MRDTSVRRREKRPRIYRGPGPARAKVDPGTDITLDPDDPEAVQCEGCGAFVKRLSHGQPRAHAPGGLATNTRKGRYACEGSGGLAPVRWE